MKFRIFATLCAVFFLLVMPAYAMDLQEARVKGVVGERLDGYVEALDSSAQSLAGDVNAKRRAEYNKISQQNGQPVDVVAKIAAERIIGGLPSGAKYQGADGSWKTR